MSDSDETEAPRDGDVVIGWPMKGGRVLEGEELWSHKQQNGGGGAPAKIPSPSLPAPAAIGVATRQDLKSLSGISARAFSLGVVMGWTSLMTLQLAYLNLTVWRASCFVSILSTFHFLEFYTTARYNPSAARISSFLLSRNGSAYNIAQTSALIEFFGRQWLRIQTLSLPSWLESNPPMTTPENLPLILGFILIAVGQGVRTAAMAEAGTSFNHVVQSRKKDDHTLVKSGVYRFLRHPSYFGFFWWSLGTQLMLSNYICFVAYAITLWRFFAARIAKEEQFLVDFFGRDYVTFKERTPVLIPFIS